MSNPAGLKTLDAPASEEGESGYELALGKLDDVLGYHVRRAHMVIHRDFLAALSDLDLTQRQAAVLWLIDSNPGVSQISIATTLGMDRATMMAIIDRLEGRGLLIRRRSTVDRRRQELYLKPAGDQLLAEAKVRIAAHEKKFVERFSPAELRALVDALERIVGA